MSLEGIAISARGARIQSARIEALAQRIADEVKNGQRVGQASGQQGGLGNDGQRVGQTDGQQGGLGNDGQLVGLEFEEVARRVRREDPLGENRVAPVLESAELIRALRALEANLQAIRIQDAILERTVNEFARPAK